MAGLSAIHGDEGDEAQNTGGLIPDPISGAYFATAIIAALNHRVRTGEGQRIDLSMIESVAVQVGDAVLDYTANGVIRKPTGNSHPRFAPHGTYPTQDGQWVSLAAESEKSFHKLSEAMRMYDDRSATNSARKKNEGALNEQIQRWTESHTLDQVLTVLQKTGVTHAPVFDFLSIYECRSEQYRACEFMVPVTHPESGEHFMPLNPWIFENTPRGNITHSPCFGQHSKEVFQQELGISDEEYIIWKQQGSRELQD